MDVVSDNIKRKKNQDGSLTFEIDQDKKIANTSSSSTSSKKSGEKNYDKYLI